MEPNKRHNIEEWLKEISQTMSVIRQLTVEEEDERKEEEEMKEEEEERKEEEEEESFELDDEDYRLLVKQARFDNYVPKGWTDEQYIENYLKRHVPKYLEGKTEDDKYMAEYYMDYIRAFRETPRQKKPKKEGKLIPVNQIEEMILKSRLANCKYHDLTDKWVEHVIDQEEREPEEKKPNSETADRWMRELDYITPDNFINFPFHKDLPGDQTPYALNMEWGQGRYLNSTDYGLFFNSHMPAKHYVNGDYNDPIETMYERDDPLYQAEKHLPTAQRINNVIRRKEEKRKQEEENDSFNPPRYITREE